MKWKSRHQRGSFIRDYSTAIEYVCVEKYLLLLLTCTTSILMHEFIVYEKVYRTVLIAEWQTKQKNNKLLSTIFSVK